MLPTKLAFAIGHTWLVLAASLCAAVDFNADFSDFAQGNVIGQTGAATGKFSGGPKWTAVVVPAPAPGSTQALEVYKTESGSKGRGYVAMPGSVDLGVPSKIYWAFDFSLPDGNSSFGMFLSNGNSEGTISNLGFGVRLQPASPSRKMTFATTAVDTTLKMTGITAPYSFSDGVWYRIEVEISQGPESGKGVFSVYASTAGNPSRTLLMENQPYEFEAHALSAYTLTPPVNGAADSAALLNNLIVKSDLEEFPIRPFVEVAP